MGDRTIGANTAPSNRLFFGRAPRVLGDEGAAVSSAAPSSQLIR